MDPGSVQYKVYASFRGGEIEVRRINIPKEYARSFHFLKTKIQEVFAPLKEKSFSLTWIDEDGDNVLMSSDEELNIALNCTIDNIKKLYVKVMDDATSDDGPNSAKRETAKTKKIQNVYVSFASAEPECSGGEGDGLHNGVVCDGCEGPVIGFRYKCMCCPDFDLCAKCEMAGNHSDHFMLRMPTSSTGALKNTSMLRHIFRSLKRETNLRPPKKSADSHPECPFTKKQRGEKHHNKDGNERHHRHHRRGGSWLETVTSYMNEFANLAGDVAAAHELSKQTVPPSNDQAQASTSSATSAPPHQDVPKETPAKQPPTSGKPSDGENTAGNTDSKTGAPETMNPVDVININYLKTIQESVAQILSPMGIVVDIDYRPNEKKKSPEPQPQEQPKPSTSSNGKENTEVESEANKEINKNNSNTPNETNEVDGRHECSPDKNDDWTMINDEPGAIPLPYHQGMKELSKVFQEQMQLHQAREREENNFGIYPQLDRASVQNSGTSTPSSAASKRSIDEISQAASQATAADQPSPSAPTTTPVSRGPPMKPHIEAALRAMIAMGFSDDGEWLTQLLISKNGNISAVLDLLTPVKK